MVLGVLVRSIKSQLLAVLCCLTGNLISNPVSAEYTAVKTQSELLEYSIPQLPLGDALREYAKQSDLGIIFPPNLVEKLESTALIGVFSERESLKLILSKTPLDFVFINDHTVVIRPLPSSAARLANSKSTLNAADIGTVSDVTPADGTDKLPVLKEILRGRVINAYSGRPLTGVSVDAPDIGVQTTSDTRGLITLENVPIGDIRLILRYSDQQEEEHFISLDESANSIIEIKFGYTAIEEIVVTGQRGSIINSIQAKRNSEAISDILSADQADRFPDQNIAEALARIPGVSFQRQNDTGDGQFISIRGLDAGLNTVLFDGLRAGSADGGGGRRTPLDIITGDNISSIKISKSLLPEDPSEGVGGIVDIRSNGPLERSDGLSLSVEGRQNSFDPSTGYRVSGRWNKKFSDRFGINLSVSYRERFFNNINIDPTTDPSLVAPLLLTGQDGTNAVFLDVDDLVLVPAGIIPNDAFTLSQINYTFADIARENLNINGAIDWKVSDTTTITFGGRFSREDQVTTESQLEFDTDVTDGFFVPGQASLIEADALLGTLFPGGIQGLSASEIQAGLSGVTAFLDDQEATFEGELEDEIETQARIFLHGETSLENWDFTYVAAYTRAYEDNPVLSIDFTQELSDLPLVPDGSDETENALGFAPFNFSSINFPAPNPQDIAVFQQLLNPFCTLQDGASCGQIVDFDEELEDSIENERFAVRFDATRYLNSDIFEYVKFGVQWERSDVTDVLIDLANDENELGLSGAFNPNNGGAGTVNDFGGIFQGDVASFDDIGNPFAAIGFNGIPLANRAALDALRQTFRASFTGAGQNPDIFQTLEAEESFYSAYLQTKATVGKLDIIAGARVEYYDANFLAPFKANFDVEVDENIGNGQQIAQSDSTQIARSADNFEILPRLALNYNISNNTKLRFGFSTALVRPEFSSLAADVESDINLELADGVAFADATIDDVQDFSIELFTGNPNLQNSYAYNFDLSFEHYFNDENAVSVAVFYKTIDNFIFQSPGIDRGVFESLIAGQPADVETILASTPLTTDGEAFLSQLDGLDALLAIADESDININQPQNGGTADVYGVELGLFHTFSYLPGFLTNFGFIGNLTLQDTDIEINLGTQGPDDALVVIGDAQEGAQSIQSFRFFNSPNFIGNAALYYDGGNFEGTLAYRFSGSQFEAVENTGLSQFQRGRGFLDLDLEYRLPDSLGFGRTRLYFSVNDLTDGGQRFSVSETIGSPSGINNLSTFNGRTFIFGARTRF